MKLRKKKKFLNRRLSQVLLLLVLIAIIGLGYHHYHKKSDTLTTSSGASVNLSAPTASDKAAVNENKGRLSTNKDGSAVSNTSAGSTEVNITYAGLNQANSNVEVSAYMPSVLEDGGKCILTMTQGANAVTRQSAAYADVNHTTCTSFSIPRSNFSSGVWIVKVSYSSPRSSGESPSTSLTL